jgi:2,4-dienoyl-CoA reductase-like NADH-dependent reductase (Old Yellow Enzyme family)
VPPPPVQEAAVAPSTAGFAVGVPRIATSRIRDVEVADRLLAEGVADAVGMTGR